MRVFYNFPSIYAIVNKTTGKSYYGQATITSRRINNELSLLRNGYHHSIHLQRSFNKHGENNFGITIIENYINLPKEFLQQALDAHEETIIKNNPNNYNCRPGGRSSFKIPPETIAKLKPSRKEMWTRPGFKENQQQHQKRVWSNPDYKNHMKNAQRSAWAQPGFKEKMSQLHKEIWASRRVRTNYTKTERSKEFKEQCSEHSKEIWQDPERLAKISIKRKALWANPEWREKQLAKIKAGWTKRKAKQPTPPQSPPSDPAP